MFNIVVKCVSLLAVSFMLVLFSNKYFFPACCCLSLAGSFSVVGTDDIEFTAISFSAVVSSALSDFFVLFSMCQLTKFFVSL